MNRVLISVLVVVLGCTERVQLGEDAPFAGLVSLTVSPADHTLAIDDLTDPAVAVDYTAVGEFADGTMRDVTSLVAWRVDNPQPGAILASGRYETSQRAGGHVTVSAIAGALVGSAALRVVVTVTIIDGTFPPPTGADLVFAPGTPVVTGDAMRSPTILYPSDATMFPQGLARILFQHQLGQANDAIRLTFESEVLHLSVLTSADRWQPDGAIWALIAASHPGSHTTFSVEAASTAAPGTIYASAPATLSFARTDPGGVLSYWSGATNGILRAPLAAMSATPQYPLEGDTACVGCHTVSRDGTRMALGYDNEKLQTVDLASLAPAISATANLPMGWATFSPDGTRVLVADKGMLVLRDATTGAPVGPDGGRVMLGMMKKATHPDWSPDGRHVVVAVSNDISNMDVKDAAIARIPYDDGAFGVPEILVPSGPMNNNYFPKWSPDGRFIAYVHATSPSRGAKSAELRVIAADGGTPRPLRFASHRVASADDIPDLANTMPTWGPPTGDIAWLAFASTRPYGAITPTPDHGQIWIVGLDLTRAGDPSFAAFWLPAQDARVLNNNPIWAVDAIPR